MWPYFGSKKTLAKYYPAPTFPKIIEPFAGTAKYSLRYFDREVLLLDKDDLIIRIWKWLQNCSPEEILNIRQLKFGENVNSFSWSCEEEKWLSGFIIGATVARPRKTATSWRTTSRPNYQNSCLQSIAYDLHKIKKWNISQGDYREIQNEQATWFIDPPYFNQGKQYTCGSKDIDYKELAEWCISRKGQVIVCEQLGADWLPFKELATIKGLWKKSTEVVWSNKKMALQKRLI